MAAVVAAAMLAAAHAIERIGDLPPCSLCLRQREVYWAILAIAALGAVAWARDPASQAARAVDALLGAAFLTGAVVAAYHAGVEWKWWPGPTECAAGGLGALDGLDLETALGAPQRIVTCDTPAIRVVGLSLAGWNAVFSLAFAGISLAAASRLKDMELLRHG